MKRNERFICTFFFRNSGNLNSNKIWQKREENFVLSKTFLYAVPNQLSNSYAVIEIFGEIKYTVKINILNKWELGKLWFNFKVDLYFCVTLAGKFTLIQFCLTLFKKQKKKKSYIFKLVLSLLHFLHYSMFADLSMIPHNLWQTFNLGNYWHKQFFYMAQMENATGTTGTPV